MSRMTKSQFRTFLVVIALLSVFFMMSLAEAQARSVYVANKAALTVSIFSATTNAVTGTISVAGNPERVALLPDGSRAYAANTAQDTVFVIDTSSGTEIATVAVGNKPLGLSIAPNGSRVYVANRGLGANTVSVIDTGTNLVVSTVAVGTKPRDTAITPDGSRVYVTNSGPNNVSVIDTSNNQVIATIPVGTGPRQLAVTPNGSRVYTSNRVADNVSVIDTSTNTVIDTVSVGSNPTAIAVSPDGSRVYVSNMGTNDTSVIETTGNTVVQTIADTSGSPWNAAVSPDGNRLYVVRPTGGKLAYINTTTNAMVGTYASGAGTQGIAFIPNQGPVTSNLTANVANAGQSTALEASATDSDGSVVLYQWDFGDGDASTTAASTITHTYSSAGNYTVTVTAIDSEGCSTSQVFTGHTVSCNGTSAATRTLNISVTAVPPDTTAPVVAFTKKPDPSTTRRRARFKFTSNETSTFECRLDGASWAGCTSPHELSGLGNGWHTFRVRARDQAGNLSEPATYSWHVYRLSSGQPDTTPPTTIITSGPSRMSRSISTVFTFYANENRVGFECRLDGDEWGACGSPQVVYGLSLGHHVFEVRAQDRAGNTGSAASWRWKVDRKAPKFKRLPMKKRKRGIRLKRSKLKYFSGLIGDDSDKPGKVKLKLVIANPKKKLDKNDCASLSLRKGTRVVNKCKWGYKSVKGSNRWRLNLPVSVRKNMRSTDRYRLMIRARDEAGNQDTYKIDFRVR